MARRASTRAAQGSGTIRKKTVSRNGKEYTYWEARYTEGIDPGTGKQIQRSITGKTQKEVAQKLKAATAAIDAGTYTTPSKMTLSEWLDIWKTEYLNGVRPRTIEAYECQIRNHIQPALGAIKLEALNAHTIQGFYNNLGRPRDDRPALSPKSIKNIHGILHEALQQAIRIGYIRFNPTDACTLPKSERKELKPLDEGDIARFMKAIAGHQYETLFLVTLFTGMREGEVLGLTWDCVDFDRGVITVNKQLQKILGGGSDYHLVPTKNGKGRVIAPAPYVMNLLKEQQRKQTEWKSLVDSLWEDTDGLVFTNEMGKHLCHHTVYQNYKRVVASIGIPSARFHDLRHSFAVASIRAGDDIKTVQGNLGHATASFTLDVYGHVTDQMKQASAARMEAFIKNVSDE